MWSVHKMEYYLVLKRNEMLICVKTRINLENSIFSERGQTQARHHMTSFW